MKILAFFFVSLLVFCVLSSVYYLVRFAYVRIKAYVIRRKLSKLAESESKKDD